MVISSREEKAELEAHLAELRDGLARAIDLTERETDAKADEDLAAFIDNEFSPNIADGFKLITKACKAYSDRVPAGLTLVESREWSRPKESVRRFAEHFSREELLAAILAESLFAIAPDVFEHESSIYGRGQVLRRLMDIDQSIPRARSGGTPPRAVRDPAKALLSDRLRARAAARRTGGHIQQDRAPEAPQAISEARSDLREVEVFATKHFAFYRDARGARQICSGRWVTLVPEIVADAAVDAGVALRTDTRQGQDAYEQQKEYNRTSGGISHTSPIKLADRVDLGDPRGYRDGGALAAAE